MELSGNPLTLEMFKKIDGYDAFMERRKIRIARAISGGVTVNISVCGLD